ncbi:MAG: hypothetical protein KBA75_07920 [Alphaproteobacteria bacterium]|nr:hypothetical protein [Alphaproteobacteria bacterium]
MSSLKDGLEQLGVKRIVVVEPNLTFLTAAREVQNDTPNVQWEFHRSAAEVTSAIRTNKPEIGLILTTPNLDRKREGIELFGFASVHGIPTMVLNEIALPGGSKITQQLGLFTEKIVPGSKSDTAVWRNAVHTFVKSREPDDKSLPSHLALQAMHQAVRSQGFSDDQIRHASLGLQSMVLSQLKS